MKNEAMIIHQEPIPLPIFHEPDKLEKAKLLINQLGKNLHEHAYMVGKILIWVQSRLHNTLKFEYWISENIWFTDRTAYHFMAFAKKCDHEQRLLDYHPRKTEHSTETVSVGSGLYQTICIDPPWPIQKIERYEAPLQGPNLDYQTMTIEAIKHIVLPAAESCHLFLWTTQKFLPDSFLIIDTWGFKYVLTMVWHKAGGFQPTGLPQYNCEFVIYGRRGNPSFMNTKDFFCCFNGKRREHSRKPSEFYDVIRRVTPEPRIDIFSREKREGFESWGNESNKFNKENE